MGKKTNNMAYYKTFEDFDEFVKNVKIPQKHWKFFQNYTDEKSDCFGVAVKAYHAAGYAEGKLSRYRARDLIGTSLMQTLLCLYRQKIEKKRENRDIGVFEKANGYLIWVIEQAKIAKDYQAVRAATMDWAKLHGQLIEKHQVIDPYADAQINKTKAFEAVKLAEQRLLCESAEEPTEPIEATFEPECPTELSNNAIESAILEQEQ